MAVQAGGKFQMKGKAEKDAYLAVDVDGMDWYFLFFNDGKPVQVNVVDSSLIDPEGTVVARGLRGPALEEKLAEIFKK